MERSAATFNSPYKPSAGGGTPPGEEGEPQHCVLLRAGGLMSILDMEQGALHTLSHPTAPYLTLSCACAEAAKLLLPHNCNVIVERLVSLAGGRRQPWHGSQKS